MAIFPNTIKNDINAFSQIFNKKDKKTGKKLYIYLPTFSNFLIEKIFNLNQSLNKGTQDIPNEYLNNINKDNFILEVNLEDERIENTPQYTISKKIDVSNMKQLQTSIISGLTEEINVFDTLKYKGELWKYFNPFEGSGTTDIFYFSFLERNAKIIGLIESLFLTTRSIPNKGITADRNLLMYGGDYEKDDIHFLEQTNCSNEYTIEEFNILKDYLNYPRTKNASSIKPIDRSTIISVILLFKYINILQKKLDTKNLELVNNFTQLLEQIIGAKKDNVYLETIINNKNNSESEKINIILDLFLKHGLFYKEGVAQLVPGFKENPSTVKELLEKYQWNYSENGNQLTSKSKTTESLFVDESLNPTGFTAIETNGRLYIPELKDSDKIYSLLKLEGRSELYGSEESIVLTQYPIKSHTNTSNKFIDIFKNNNRNTSYMDGKIIDYQTYFKRFNNNHGLKSFGLIDELKKDIETLFSIELNPQNITNNKNVEKAYTGAFKDLYKDLLKNNSLSNYSSLFKNLNDIFDKINSIVENLNSAANVAIDETNFVNSLNSFETSLNNYNQADDSTIESLAQDLDSKRSNLNLEKDNYNQNINNYINLIKILKTDINNLKKNLIDINFNFITNNSLFFILFKVSEKYINDTVKIFEELKDLPISISSTSESINYNNFKTKNSIVITLTKDIKIIKDNINKNKTKIDSINLSNKISDLIKINNIYSQTKNNTLYTKMDDLFDAINKKQSKITYGDETSKVYINYKDCITAESFSNKLNNVSSLNVFFIETDDGKKSKFLCKKEIVKILENFSKYANFFGSLEKVDENKVLEKIDNSYLLHTTDFSYVTQQDWLQNPLTPQFESVKLDTNILNNIEPFKPLVYNSFTQSGDKINFEDTEEYFNTLGLSDEQSYLTIPDKIGTTILNLKETSIDEFKTIFNNIMIDELDIDLEDITLDELEEIINENTDTIKEIEENVIRHLVFGSYHWYIVTLLGENLKKYNQAENNFINKWNIIGFHNTLQFSTNSNEVEIFTEIKTKPILDQDLNLIDYNNDLIEEDDIIGKDTNKKNLDPAIITFNRRNRNFFKRLIIPLMGKSNTNTPFYYKFKFNSSENLVEFKNSHPLFIDEFREKSGSGPLNFLVNPERTKPKSEQKITTSIIEYVYSKLKLFGEQDKVIFDKTNNNVSVDDISEEEYDETIDTLKATTLVNFKKLKKVLDGAVVPVHFGLSPYLKKS